MAPRRPEPLYTAHKRPNTKLSHWDEIRQQLVLNQIKPVTDRNLLISSFYNVVALVTGYVRVTLLGVVLHGSVGAKVSECNYFCTVSIRVLSSP